MELQAILWQVVSTFGSKLYIYLRSACSFTNVLKHQMQELRKRVGHMSEECLGVDAALNQSIHFNIRKHSGNN